jgi:peptidoglycan/LPS O-acetylase OafA/YrhL
VGEPTIDPALVGTKTQSLPGSLPYYLLLAANVPYSRSHTLHLLGHYWSLGVEEQFYLFWPWVVRRQKLAKIFGVLIFLFLLFKFAARAYWIYSGHNTPYAALDVTRFDCMAIGGLGAVWFHKREAMFSRFCSSIVTQAVVGRDPSAGPQSLPCPSNH